MLEIHRGTCILLFNNFKKVYIIMFSSFSGKLHLVGAVAMGQVQWAMGEQGGMWLNTRRTGWIRVGWFDDFRQVPSWLWVDEARYYNAAAATAATTAAAAAAAAAAAEAVTAAAAAAATTAAATTAAAARGLVLQCRSADVAQWRRWATMHRQGRRRFGWSF